MPKTEHLPEALKRKINKQQRDTVQKELELAEARKDVKKIELMTLQLQNMKDLNRCVYVDKVGDRCKNEPVKFSERTMKLLGIAGAATGLNTRMCMTHLKAVGLTYLANTIATNYTSLYTPGDSDAEMIMWANYYAKNLGLEKMLVYAE